MQRALKCHYRCAACSKKFASTSHLVRHVKTAHGHATQHCPYCEVSSAQNLISHIRNCHAREYATNHEGKRGGSRGRQGKRSCSAITETRVIVAKLKTAMKREVSKLRLPRAVIPAPAANPEQSPKTIFLLCLTRTRMAALPRSARLRDRLGQLAQRLKHAHHDILVNIVAFL